MSKASLKSGFVSIIGRPNVGKSTLMNHLIGQKIAITSSRAQTTRKEIKTIFTDDRGQIIFLDTPGVTKADSKLGEFMLEQATDTLKTADAIMWIVEPSKFIGKGERLIASLIGKAVKGRKNELPVILVVNKVDTLDGRSDKVEYLEGVYDTYSDYSADEEGFEFSDILSVSATEGLNSDILLETIFDRLPEGPMYYDEETVTDETEREIAAEFIREKCLKFLDKEVPHGIAVIIENMKDRPDGRLVDIEAAIICEKDSHKGIIIGKNGATLKRIGTAARHDIEDMLQMKVNLKIWVKVRRDWRNNKLNLSEYGYR